MRTEKKIYPPNQLFAELPLFEREVKQVRRYRQIAKRIFAGEDSRIPIIVGPCSIHSIDGAIDYAKKLKTLFDEVSETLFPIMRVYVEKPRTTTGWKGLLHDPYLNGTNDLSSGIRYVRDLLIQLARLGIPAATEFLNPLTAQYYHDLITWGFIGARTSSSQIHREIASSMNFPIGFKNNIDGNMQIPINSVISARSNHNFFSIDYEGMPVVANSNGNPFTHLVLRGSDTQSNHDQKNIEKASSLQKKSGVLSKVLIDCAHGNSQKNPAKQKEVFFEVAEQIAEGNPNIMGLMMESYLEEGSQTFEFGDDISPTISITDPCIGWDDTEILLRWLNNTLKQKAKIALV